MTAVTIERTPGGYYFVQVAPPHPKYPSRSFPTMAKAREYKWTVELHTTEDEDGKDGKL